MIDLVAAKLVAQVVETAEGGCSGCLNEAVKDLNEKFPEFIWSLWEPVGFMPSIDVKPKTPDAPKASYVMRKC